MVDTIKTARDGLETAILLALSARNRASAKKRIGVEKQKTKGWDREIFDAGMFCPDRAEFPSQMYAMTPGNDDRLYSASLADLVVSPAKAIGRGLETATLCAAGMLKWAKVKPMPKPRGLVAMTNQKHDWFAWHYREISEGKPDTYIRRPMAIAGNDIVPTKCLLAKGWDSYSDAEEMEQQLALTLSVFEDAIRSNAILATVEESARFSFPVGDDGYVSFFRLRDGLKNTPTGRRNPILHWCSEHLRSRGDKVFSVKRHERGTAEIVEGPMRLTLTFNEGYGAYV